MERWYELNSLIFSKENGLAFATTPAGLRSDYTIFKDGIVQMPEIPFNLNWNTFWDVKTTRDSLGWYLEMRIPLSSMRFKEIDGTAVMGMTCFRQIAHKNETDIFPAIPPNWGPFSIYRPSQSREIVFNPNSYVGRVAVSRIGNDGHYNIGYGLDATIKMFGDDYLVAKAAQVMDDSAVNKAWQGSMRT